MKTALRVAVLAGLAMSAMPAAAGVLSGASLLEVAQVVLKGKALLGKGQAQCGTAAALKPQESLLLTAATAAVQKALPQPKFDALSLLANRQATTASAAPGFCSNAAQAKPGLIGQVAGAAQRLGGDGGELGMLAGALGGGTPAPATGGAAAAALGGLLGK